jgi:hypothetical protein
MPDIHRKGAMRRKKARMKVRYREKYTKVHKEQQTENE